jgi:hypothetical protein
MAINDPIYPNYVKRKDYWILQQGRETWYDEDNALITFESAEEALEWARNNLEPWQLELLTDAHLSIEN